ncbi:NAD(P)/FAD-dependent oxidoreductase [Caenimonas aquaedulcis]|uniref:FAD-dependent oxidoreductase n=1 Tax=Caenimonas aquaedulcis TaxID=2793270 RepID=A0A931MI39_9BURK|nr:FAD-dependent oxidoreductase [Caenimonas aquaedulcis]MBG9389582.1 FAD-dependent oxidoreductase [Caenimonas aquaedulcis]
MKVAVVGSGIAGLAAAHALRWNSQVSLFEAGEHFGGHANTVDVTLGGVTHGVDTGFLVYNERTYPGLIRLFAELGVATAKSDMSFSVQVPRAFGGRALEWSGTSLSSVFCQRANLGRPGFWRMLRDLLRFNRDATQIAESTWSGMDQSLGGFLDTRGYSREFREWYLLPMIGCIWSGPTQDMLRFPVGTLVRFCHNHGLLQIADRPQWYTVTGGSREYVRKIVDGLADARVRTPVRRIEREEDGVWITTDAGTARFDRVVIATHPDQALAVLPDASALERGVLGAIRYQHNHAILHTDSSVLPRHRGAWAAWNYEASPAGAGRAVCLHYLINRLQPLPWEQPVIVSLNPVRRIDAAAVIREFDYEHPVFDAGAVRAQRQLAQLQGRRNTWFCGAWAGYGFHEDGLVSGQAAAKALLVQRRIEEVEALA